MGAHYNAFTNEENTVFTRPCFPNISARAVELWADILRPSLREEDFRTEKKSDYRGNQDVRGPSRRSAPTTNAGRLSSVPTRWDAAVLGTEKSIADLHVEAMRDYFGRRYAPENIVFGRRRQVPTSPNSSAPPKTPADIGNPPPLSQRERGRG